MFSIFKCLPLTLLLLLMFSKGFGQSEHSFQPKEGFVPDSKTAISIAEAVLIPVYGEERIKAQRPFTATLQKDVWIVEGTPSKEKEGGVAIVKLSKRDGRIVSLTHGR